MDRTLVRLTRWTALAVLVLALAAPGALSAQDSTANHLYDKFQATLDFSTVLNNSEARVDGSAGQGTTLNFKDLLGVTGTSIQPAIGLRWKPGRHTELAVGYQFINASGTRAFSRDSTDPIVIGDDSLSGSISADTKLGSDNATFQFKYSILAKDKYNVGLALGLGAIFFDLDFEGTAEVCGGTNCESGSLSTKRSFTGPTASLGAFGQWRVSDRWYVGGDARGIGAKVDRFDFSVFEADVGAKYFFSNRWGAGLGLYYTDVSVDVGAKSDGSAAEDLVGKVSYNYTSLRLGVIGAF